jgi:hypothetical protein
MGIAMGYGGLVEMSLREVLGIRGEGRYTILELQPQAKLTCAFDSSRYTYLKVPVIVSI